MNSQLLYIWKVVYYSSFVWIPAFLIDTLIDLWIQYRRTQFLAKQTYTLLEVKLPKEIFKSPRAAEFFIAGLNQGFGEGNWYEKY